MPRRFCAGSPFGFHSQVAGYPQSGPSRNGTETFFQGFHFFWRLIRGQYDLFACGMQHVKGVEKFFLCTFFPIITVISSIIRTSTVRIFSRSLSWRLRYRFGWIRLLRGKGFRSDIKNLHIRILLQDEVTDGMHQMRFPRPAPP